MTQPGYQEGNERVLWWKVAMHLDEAKLSAANAMGHNLDDQTRVLALQDKLREAQAILLEIFHTKGLLPSDMNGKFEVPLPVAPPPVPPPPVPPPPVPLPVPPSLVMDAVPATKATASEIAEEVASVPASAAQEAAVYEAAIEDSAPPTEAVVEVPVAASSSVVLEAPTELEA